MINSIKNIGEWFSHIEKQSGKLHIMVDGTFPTNGEKPSFRLMKNNPQGVNPTELVLTLEFGSLVESKGITFATVYYSEPIEMINEFLTVLVIDGNGRNIANINVANYKTI